MQTSTQVGGEQILIIVIIIISCVSKRQNDSKSKHGSFPNSLKKIVD